MTVVVFMPRFINIAILKLTELRTGQVEGWKRPSRVQPKFRLSVVHGSERLGGTILYSIKKYSAKSTIHFKLKFSYSNMTSKEP